MSTMAGQSAPPLAQLLGVAPMGEASSPGVDGGGAELDALDQIAAAIDAYIQLPTVEESERLIAEKMKTMCQQLKAQNEKMSDQITGGNPALRKALGA